MTASHENTGFAHWAAQVQRLYSAVETLSVEATVVGAQPPVGQPWYELLRHKLIPQLTDTAHLVVAVVGGTNIGKSALFNQLAGEEASAVSPLAAGTRHPVCLAPTSLTDVAVLERLFEGFTLRGWQSAADALSTDADNLLFWRAGANVPPRLLLLDTPDIDSDVEVNWQRAGTIRDAADVLVAVLTQQKYNDAAVKRFFREAAAADKPVIVVFNQCDPEQDRDYWPQWLATFREATRVQPLDVYVVPYDRAGAANCALKFFSTGPDGTDQPRANDLRHALGALHFDAIKTQTLRGALGEVLDPERGAPAYCVAVRLAAARFAGAARTIEQLRSGRVGWPSLPANLLVEQIRAWWEETQRHGWSRGVHRFYRTIGQAVAVPLKKAYRMWQDEASDPLAEFHRREREAVIRTVESVVSELERLADSGNDILRPRLRRVLSGPARRELIERVAAAHEELPLLDTEYRAYVRGELDRWGQENPRAVTLLRSLDQTLAAARPVITLSLVLSGGIFATGAADQLVIDVAGHTAGQLAGEAALTSGMGEAAMTATGVGVKQAAALLFRRLQTHYAELRARWLTDWLRRELLGGVLEELERGAAVATSPAMNELDGAVRALAPLGRERMDRELP